MFYFMYFIDYNALERKKRIATLVLRQEMKKMETSKFEISEVMGKNISLSASKTSELWGALSLVRLIQHPPPQS